MIEATMGVRFNADGRWRAHESILRDLAAISSLDTPTSFRKAVLKLLIDNPNKSFDRKSIKRNVERKYKSLFSSNSDTLRSILSSLESHGFIKRINSLGCYKIAEYTLHEFLKNPGAENYYIECKKIESLKTESLNYFISENMGKEIEFRYKTDRPRSDKWWRRVRIYDQDDMYLYVADYYPSGGRIRYLKEKIVEYRRVFIEEE